MSSMIGRIKAFTMPRTRPVARSERYLSASPKPYVAFPHEIPGTKMAATAMAIALISARQMMRIGGKTMRSGLILREHSAAAHGLLGSPDDPTTERIGHDREPEQYGVLERGVEQRPRAQCLDADDIDRVCRRQHERDRLEHSRQKRHRKRRAGQHAEQKVHRVYEEVRLTYEQDDGGKDVRDAHHREDRQTDGGQGQQHLRPQPETEEPDAEGEERDLRQDEPEEAPQRAADHERLVMRRRKP